MNCNDVTGTLGVWDPRHELPDPLVDHLEACPDCLAQFDLRFPPISVAAVLAEPSRRRAHPMVALAVAAALALVALGWSPAVPQTHDPLAHLSPPECPVPADLPPECPQA